MATKKQTAEMKEIEVEIVQEPMVGWFQPQQLVRTGMYALLGSLFGAYADRREVQAALQDDGLDEEAAEIDYSHHKDGLWIDYVADLGDGWDATYSIAWLLSQPTLTFGNTTTQRGRLLIMGGDQVYPTATRETYQNRFIGPYTAALPWTDKDSPHLYAIPGNHDWYDGLTGFLRLFCQRRWIGGRSTRQRRSYFALKLPYRWWWWAVDIQLEADLDEPQKKYFEHFSKALKPGDRVVLCTAEPSWIEAGDPEHRQHQCVGQSHPNLVFLQQLIYARRAEIKVTLAGDLHHYSHYVSSNTPRHKITSGGGGAYVFGTHKLPETLELTEADKLAHYEFKEAYPRASTSRWLRWKNVGFCFYNRSFSLFVGLIYLFYAWIWQSASKVPGQRGSLMEQLSEVPFGVSAFFCDVLPRLWITIAHHPGSMVMTTLIPVGLMLFASAPPGRWSGVKRFVWGATHGAAHLFLGAALLWAFSIVNLVHVFSVDRMDSLQQVLLFTVEVLGSGFVLGGTFMGLYLALSNKFGGLHAEHVFSALHIADYKNFLRLHLGSNGLTIYPIGVETVCRQWDRNPAAQVVDDGHGQPGRRWTLRVAERLPAAWFSPRTGTIPAHLIEAPIQIETRDKP